MGFFLNCTAEEDIHARQLRIRAPGRYRGPNGIAQKKTKAAVFMQRPIKNDKL